MTRNSPENEGITFGPGTMHVGDGIIGFGVGTESYIPLFKTVAPMESLEKSAQNAFGLFQVEFESESNVIAEIRNHIEKVVEHVTTRAAPLVEDYEAREKRCLSLVKAKRKAERTEEEQTTLNELLENQEQARRKLRSTKEELRLKSMTEILRNPNDIALVLEVHGARGWMKDKDGRNYLRFYLGIISRDASDKTAFNIDTVNIAEADVHTGEIKPIIYSGISERGKKDLGDKNLIPIIIASSQSLPKPKTG